MICNYGDCLEQVEDKGVIVSLRRASSHGEKRAVFCCAAHAVASLQRLCRERGETAVKPPIYWKTK